MSSSIRVGIITEATGGHLKGYLRRLATHEGVETIGMADPTGKMFEQAQQTLGPRAAGLQTYSDYRSDRISPCVFVNCISWLMLFTIRCRFARLSLAPLRI